ncbi:MAG: TlpA family protein disulfide reductase [Pyrinomonadaceae bacterium]|nr:TlpA family protein disulfide reductase [Pyrinomonadaceae bacterium]
MRAFLVLALLLMFFPACRPSAAPTGISNRPSSVNGVPLETFPPTKPIENMSWMLFDGETNENKSMQRIKDFRGKVLILDFWATYCPPCLEEIPHLKQIQEKYKDELQVIGLHVGGTEDRQKVPDFYRKLQINYPLATPEEALTRFIFGPNTEIPQTAIFDRNGRFVRKFAGFNEQIKKEMNETIDKVVNSK